MSSELSGIDSLKNRVSDSLSIRYKKAGTNYLFNDQNVNIKKDLNKALKFSSFAQPAKSNVNFGGTVTVQSRYSNYRDTLSLLPNSYATVTARPTISFGAVPITSTIIYSTDKGLQGKRLRNINFSLDANGLRRNIKDRFYQQRAGLNSYLSTTNHAVPDLSIGQFFPSALDTSLIPPKKPSIFTDPQAYNDLFKLEKISKAKNRQRLADSLRIYFPEYETKVDSLFSVFEILNSDSVAYEKKLDSLRKFDKAKYRELKKLKALSNFRNTGKIDLEEDRSSLKSLGGINKSEHFLLGFQRLNIGDAYPYYSDLSMMGVRIRGLDVCYDPGSYSIAFTGGTTTQVRSFSKQFFREIDDRILAGSIGVKNETSELKLAHVNVSRKSDAGYSTGTSNEANRVYQVEGKVNILKNLSGRGVFAGSQYQIFPTEGKMKPSIKDYGYVVTLDYSLPKLNTTLSTQYRKIGEYYTAFAVPFMRTGYQQANIRIANSILKKQILTEVTWTREITRASRYKSASSLNSFGGTISILFNKLPYLVLSYQPLKQTTEDIFDTLFINEVSYSTFIAQTGHQFRIGKIILQSTGGYIKQKQNASLAAINTASEIFYFTQAAKLNKRLQILGTYNKAMVVFHESSMVNEALDFKTQYSAGKYLTGVGFLMAKHLRDDIYFYNRQSPYAFFGINTKAHNLFVQYTFMHFIDAVHVSYDKYSSETIAKYIIKF